MVNTEAMVANFLDACRDNGLKVTHQRTEIYRELASRRDHPSAEALFVSIRSKLPTVALDTVYRTLRTFEEINIVRRLDIFDDQARFDANMAPHHHCICSNCHKIVDFQWDEFYGLGLPSSVSGWGRVDSRNVVLRGICRDCLLGAAGR